MIINVDLEEWTGSPVIRTRGNDYRHLPARQFDDAAARLTPRQGVFYRNLIRMAEALGSNVLPVDFELPNGQSLYLDRGCIKIAEHAGFIEELENNASGTVDRIQLRFRC